MSAQRTLLDERLAAAKSSKRLAFLPFLVVGDPHPEGFIQMAKAMVEAGADALELGLPFSDPPADGPVVQAADLRALSAGITTEKAFELMEQVHRQHDIPISLLVYFNLIMQAGAEAFFERCRAVGIDAVLVADVPFELSEPIFRAARAAGVSPVCLASAVSSSERAKTIREIGEAYVYAAARVGITGVQQTVAESSLGELVTRLRHAEVTLPILAGFGLSRVEHIHAVRDAGADGCIVGSSIIDQMARHLPDIDAGVAAAHRLAHKLSVATRTKA